MVQGKSVAFAAEFEPAVALGRRRSMRAPVSLDARIGRGGLDRALCRVVDLSLHGARLQTYSALRQVVFGCAAAAVTFAVGRVLGVSLS